MPHPSPGSLCLPKHAEGTPTARGAAAAKDPPRQQLRAKPQAQAEHGVAYFMLPCTSCSCTVLVQFGLSCRSPRASRPLKARALQHAGTVQHNKPSTKPGQHATRVFPAHTQNLHRHSRPSFCQAASKEGKRAGGSFFCFAGHQNLIRGHLPAMCPRYAMRMALQNLYPAPSAEPAAFAAC